MRCLIALRTKRPDVRVTHVITEDDDEVGSPRGRSVVVVSAPITGAILSHENRRQELQKRARDDRSDGWYHCCIPIAVGFDVPDDW